MRLGSKEFPAADDADPGRIGAPDPRRWPTTRSVPVYGASWSSRGWRRRPADCATTSSTMPACPPVDEYGARPGAFPAAVLAAKGSPDAPLMDYLVEHDATEFTLPELRRTQW